MKCSLDQTLHKTLIVTGYQQPLPSCMKGSQKYCQSSEIESASNLCAHVCARRSAWYCQQFRTPSGFPQRHVATRVTLHSGRNSPMIPLWAQTPTSPLTILPGLLQKLLCPPGHCTAQNNRTHQHFHLHPWASSDTAAAAVRPLAGTDSSEKY